MIAIVYMNLRTPGLPTPGPYLSEKSLSLDIASFVHVCLCVCVLSYVLLFETPLTTDWQALLSLEFSNQEYWSGLPFPSPMHESEK